MIFIFIYFICCRCGAWTFTSWLVLIKESTARIRSSVIWELQLVWPRWPLAQTTTCSHVVLMGPWSCGSCLNEIRLSDTGLSERSLSDHCLAVILLIYHRLHKTSYWQILQSFFATYKNKISNGFHRSQRKNKIHVHAFFINMMPWTFLMLLCSGYY